MLTGEWGRHSPVSMNSSSDQELNDATYYNSTGAQLNTDCTYLNFGWNPDWGDPNNYLDQLIPGGYSALAASTLYQPSKPTE